MSETKREEWKFLPEFGRVESKKQIICYIAGGVTEAEMEEALGNVELIAASRELLEAAQGIARFDEDSYDAAEFRKVMNNLKAAIRKAKGMIPVHSHEEDEA